MHVARSLVVVALLAFGAGCGSSDSKKADRPAGGGPTACGGAALSKPNLPARFPEPKGLTLTRSEVLGPTTTLNGYFKGSIREGHDAFKSGFEDAGYTVLFDEVETRDSEVSWKGQGRSGQVALRDQCKQPGRVVVRITNRPTGT